MRYRLISAMTLAIAALGAPSDGKKSSEPKVTSIYPVSARRGTHIQAEIRGSALTGARDLMLEGNGITGRVLRIDPLPASASEASKDDKETVHVQLEIAPSAALGWHEFRLVTAAGVTNKARTMVVDEPVVDSSEADVPLRQFPLVVNGRILHAGENQTYAIDPEPGATLTIEAVSGNQTFDPTLTLFEESGSWFDPHRYNRLAFNDEPLSFPGLSTNARLVWRFNHQGKYRVQVNSFEGKGGADCVYQLRISPGEMAAPPLHPDLNPEAQADWEERQFTRTIREDWLEALGRRGGIEEKPRRPELFHAALEGSKEIPVMTLPAVVEGRIGKPGETHAIRLKMDKPEDLAIEVETPQATLPRFNPVVRLLQPDGHEMATDVYTKLNNNGLYMMKMIEPKTALNLQAPGEYTLTIRDITVDCAGADFHYRVLLRKQIPHVGKVDIGLDHVNLEPGGSKPVSVKLDREEGFAGYVTVAVKDLPPGVVAMQAMDNPEDKPPLPNAGKAERYFPKNQITAVLLVASSDAPVTLMPAKARLEVSVVSQGKLGPVIATKEIPVMVVEHKAP